jgi:hypothetical protein
MDIAPPVVTAPFGRGSVSARVSFRTAIEGSGAFLAAQGMLHASQA